MTRLPAVKNGALAWRDLGGAEILVNGVGGDGGIVEGGDGGGGSVDEGGDDE